MSIGQILIELLLLIIVGVVVIAIVKRFWGAGEDNIERAIRDVTRPTFRRGVIVFAESVTVVLVVVFTIAGAVLGGVYSGILSGIGGGNRQQAEVFGALLGGTLAFSTASLLLGIILAVGAIERNTRATATLLSLLAKPHVPME